MQMSKIQIINFCRSWMGLIDPLRDLKYQSEFWFDPNKSLISSYEETLELFLGNYERTKEYGEFKEILNVKCCDLIENLYQKVQKYEPSTERDIKYSAKEALLGDPDWLTIVDLAQKNYEALENYVKGIENATG